MNNNSLNELDNELEFWRAASKLRPHRALAVGITLIGRTAMEMADWHESDERRQVVGAAIDALVAEINSVGILRG